MASNRFWNSNENPRLTIEVPHVSYMPALRVVKKRTMSAQREMIANNLPRLQDEAFDVLADWRMVNNPTPRPLQTPMYQEPINNSMAVDREPRFVNTNADRGYEEGDHRPERLVGFTPREYTSMFEHDVSTPLLWNHNSTMDWRDSMHEDERALPMMRLMGLAGGKIYHRDGNNSNNSGLLDMSAVRGSALERPVRRGEMGRFGWGYLQ